VNRATSVRARRAGDEASVGGAVASEAVDGAVEVAVGDARAAAGPEPSPRRSGCANEISGVTNSTRFVSPNARKNGDATASGCTAEQVSCQKPDATDSRVEAPPPPAASARTRGRAARARVTAAASPFGPDPTTSTSVMRRRLPVNLVARLAPAGAVRRRGDFRGGVRARRP
jgi:hypothetical protein